MFIQIIQIFHGEDPRPSGLFSEVNFTFFNWYGLPNPSRESPPAYRWNVDWMYSMSGILLYIGFVVNSRDLYKGVTGNFHLHYIYTYIYSTPKRLRPGSHTSHETNKNKYDPFSPPNLPWKDQGLSTISKYKNK